MDLFHIFTPKKLSVRFVQMGSNSSGDFDITKNMVDKCLDHGLDGCEMVCIETECKQFNSGQPAPLCQKCVSQDHDSHKMRCWTKVKKEEIERKSGVLKRKRRVAQIPLKDFKPKDESDVFHPRGFLKRALIKALAEEPSSSEKHHLIEFSENLTEKIQKLSAAIDRETTLMRFEKKGDSSAQSGPNTRGSKNN